MAGLHGLELGAIFSLPGLSCLARSLFLDRCGKRLVPLLVLDNRDVAPASLEVGERHEVGAGFHHIAVCLEAEVFWLYALGLEELLDLWQEYLVPCPVFLCNELIDIELVSKLNLCHLHHPNNVPQGDRANSKRK